MTTGVPEGFSVKARRDGTTVTLVLSGELDLHSSKLLDHELDGVSDAPVLEVDAGAITFVDSAGLRSLLVACKAAKARDAEFRFVAVSDQLARIVRMAGLTDFLPGAPTASGDEGTAATGDAAPGDAAPGDDSGA
jgi:anti-anti-sigma factor